MVIYKRIKEYFMKKKLVLAGIISVLAVFGLILASCDNGNTSNNANGTPTTGSITIKNNSNTFSITYVDVYDVDTDTTIFYTNTAIAKGVTATFNNIDPGNKLRVFIVDSKWDEYYGMYSEHLSNQFALRAGETKVFVYDGDSLSSN
jgi:hypothetical protein